MIVFDHLWWWRVSDRPLGSAVDRRHRACRIVARGTKNSVLVEFPDGYRVVTSRWAVRPGPHHVHRDEQLPLTLA